MVKTEIMDCGMKVYVQETPAGYVGYAWTQSGVAAVTLPCHSPPAARAEVERCTGGDSRGAVFVPPAPGEAVYGLGEALREYFGGRCPDFARFPVDFSPYTPFRKKVLQAARQIPYGKVASYGQIAARAGSPRACRAAGGALNANRVLYIVPCHRVVNSDGSLGGFGCGLYWKRRLLNLENIEESRLKKYMIDGK